MKQIVLIMIVMLYSSALLADYTQVTVMTTGDEQAEGTLRTALHYACDVPGDEKISFTDTSLDKWEIVLKSPLVIPADCKGRIHIQGFDNIPTIFNGKQFSKGGDVLGDSCVVNVYSDGNTLDRLIIGGNEKGAGICLFGRNNSVIDTQVVPVEKNNRYGVLISNIHAANYPEMDGSGNSLSSCTIRESMREALWIESEGNDIFNNTIADNGGDGIHVRGDDNLFLGNSVRVNGGCPPGESSGTAWSECFDGDGMGGVGMHFRKGASYNVVGPITFSISNTDQMNKISHNRDGGIVVEGEFTYYNHITHNEIFGNFGSTANLDLGFDGITPNDDGDIDSGPNKTLNYIEHLQFLPLASGSRYWGWGVSFSGKRVELYNAASEDYKKGLIHGGAGSFLIDKNLVGDTFQLLPNDPLANTLKNRVTTLVFDSLGNTSEFSLTIPVGPDTDLDGLPDWMENSDIETGSSSKNEADSDFDRLPDAVEDQNRNGKWEADQMESATFLTDTDGDALDDWAETHGDGIYDAGVDTNPLLADTDGDGWHDGKEDFHGNGLWEAYLGETSPLLKDSDGDGIDDVADNCPIIPNPGQEAFVCQ